MHGQGEGLRLVEPSLVAFGPFTGGLSLDTRQSTT